jgi:hypothetical protein
MRALVLLVLATALGCAAGRPHGLASLTEGEIARLRARVAADPEAARRVGTPRARADLAVTEEPHPIARLTTEGRLDGDPDKLATEKALADMGRLEALGLAYALTGAPPYLAAIARDLDAWARVNQPTGDPIDETSLEQAIVAFDLCAPALAPETRTRVARWLERIAAAEIASRRPGRGTAINNWNSHRLKLVGLIGYALDDGTLIDWARRGFEAQIAANLKPDGTSIDFVDRDALHYHVYDLVPLLRLAIVLARDGGHPYTWRAPSGATLAAGVAFLLPFARGEAVHGEFVHTRVAFDRERAANGQAAYQPGRRFEPVEARPALELAQFFEPDLVGLVGSLGDTGAAPWPTVRVLLNDAMRPAL